MENTATFAPVMGAPKSLSARQLRAYLERWGMSQSDLAERLGVERRTVVRWLAGYPIPGPVRAAVHAWAQMDGLRDMLDRD